ncbi:MAG: adenylate/guanylate cyclase domain-containing protein [Leptospirales bacterium]|jgi:class 3 adenylate cyclase/HAMP domain-containing protein
MRFSFALKLSLAFSLLAVISTGATVVYFYWEARQLVLLQMGNRLKDIGRTGSYLFDQQEREDLKYLAETVRKNVQFTGTDEQRDAIYGEDDIAGTDDDGTYEALPAELSSKIMAGAEFKRVVQSLREIREGSRRIVRPLHDVPALHIIQQEEDQPTLQYVYMLMPVPGHPVEKYLIYLADSDYLPVDANDDGDFEDEDDGDYEGNPIGNITLPVTAEMYLGFSGEAVSEKDFTEDQWGDVVISGFVPILGNDGEILAVLGMDYNVKSEANRIKDLRTIAIVTVVVVFFLAILISILMAQMLNRPIKKLQAGAERVAERDFSTQIDVRSRDELGVLANSFNLMVTEIREYAQNLEALNSAYERFVPQEFLFHMGQQNIIDVKLGDQVQREMTVLFSDIRSFTTISESMTPKENFDFLNAYLQRISPLIRKHQGFIDKFIGDAIMALFPGTVEDAVEGAIHMQMELQDFNRVMTDIPPVRIGVGLHTGNLMLGTIGEERRMESTVISDAVNLASRLEGLTKNFGTGILISEHAVNQLNGGRDRILIRHLGRVRVKGKKGLIKVFEIYNSDPEDVRDMKSETREKFEDALHLFQEGKFGDAGRLFQEIVEANDADNPARAYLERCLRD